MSAALAGTKRRWLISALSAAAVLAVLLPLFHSPSPRGDLPRATARPEAPIKLAPARADELAMRDLKPLFLPTPYNAAPTEPAHLEPGGALLARDDEKLKFKDENPALRLPSPVQVPAGPVEAIANPPGPLALGIGRVDARLPAAPAHGAYVDLYVAGTGKRVFEDPLVLEPRARPMAANREIMDWRPLEFLAAVDPAGLVGPLVLTRSSGVEDVDNHFRNYLARTYNLGDRLPPGFYRIVVAP